MAEREIQVGLGERSYAVRIGEGVLARSGELLGGLRAFSRLVVVTNSTVAALYKEPLLEALSHGPAAGLEPIVVELPDGEQYKTLATLESIYDAVLDSGADRSTVMLALGGGVVGDVAGFAAATILRGIPLVMIPTTLLAQVDSSVGGKTAINRPQGKNLVGAFFQPSLVLADPLTLRTLPDREYRAGLAEVVKYGVILDAELFELLEDNAAAVAANDVELMTDIVARCVRLKADVVEQDERESGLRQILNFGHTVGHALEKATAYSHYLHGEAVAIGMAAAMRLSAKIGICADSDVGRLESLLGALGLAYRLPAEPSWQTLAEAAAFDKKARAEHVAFIVAERIGSCRSQDLTPAEIGAALMEMPKE